MATQTRLYNLVETFVSGAWHIQRRSEAPYSRTYCGLKIAARNAARGNLQSFGAVCGECRVAVEN